MKLYLKISALAFGILFSINSCKKENAETPTPANNKPSPYQLAIPSNFPEIIIPADNPMTVEGVQLGRRLYYDSILSSNGLSCSSCHNQQYAFTLPTVASMSHTNLAWSNSFLWNGKVSGVLEDIMMFEVEEFFHTDISKLNNHSDYPALFKKAFGTEQITSKEAAYALAQFVRTLISGNSKFDKFLRHETQLNSAELNGYVIFSTEKGDCFHCHSISLFADNNFHNIGLDSVFSGVNAGRYNVTGNPNDMGKFKTPTLRNTELTAPYMHDRRFQTLDEVVEHYNSGVLHSATLDPIMTKPGKEFGLQLTAQEKADLIAFLKTLTDKDFVNNPDLKSPF